MNTADPATRSSSDSGSQAASAMRPPRVRAPSGEHNESDSESLPFRGDTATGSTSGSSIASAAAGTTPKTNRTVSTTRFGDEGEKLTRTVLSGNLSRCTPVFSPSSDIVFCACSSSVLALNVDTGEQLFRLDGHTGDVTAMLVLPPGQYGEPEAKRASGRGLLTSSMDGNLRLWDIAADLLSLEGEEERCLGLFHVGKPVYRLLQGRRDGSGRVAEVVAITRGVSTSTLHGLSKDWKHADAEDMSEPVPSAHGDLEGMEVESEEEGGGGGEGEGGKGREGSDEGGTTDGTDDGTSDSSDGEGQCDESTRGSGEAEALAQEKDESTTKSPKGSSKFKRSRVHGDKFLYDWQALRYSLAAGKVENIIHVARRQRRWIGTMAPHSPLRGALGRAKRGQRCPVLIWGDGRNVTAIDTATGDERLLVRASGPVCSIAIGAKGDLLVTGHTDGSMNRWESLHKRLGAAFGMAGFEGSDEEPATSMHWHARPVGCMGVATDGVQLYTGGEEAVLVQWNLEKRTKAFLPRLGAPLKELAVSPGQEHVVVVSDDNAVTFVGLAGWDVTWQIRGLALTRPRVFRAKGSKARSEEERLRSRQSLKLTVEPKRGLVACNGRAGHVQFYNLATDCLEASVEVVRFNRDSSAKTFLAKQLAGALADSGTMSSAVAGATMAAAAAAANVGPVVERVAFSADGKRMVAVASRLRSADAPATPSLSFWRHARGVDPYRSAGYRGSYTGASNVNRRASGRGTWGHWASDTSVENPHGPGNGVTALEYHPVQDVVATASDDGSLNLWGLRKGPVTGESLVAAPKGVEEEPRERQPVHWACSLSVRYKEGMSATCVSFSSDGSVLAVSYIPNGARTESHRCSNFDGQGVIVLWSLETVTLLSTLLPARMPSAEPALSLHSLSFLPGSGRVFAAGSGFAAVWDMVSPGGTPIWEYRAHILAAATVDAASVLRTGKEGIPVQGTAFGDVVICVDAASLESDERQGGSVVLLFNSRRPTPLYTWRLAYDKPTCLRLALSGPSSESKEGILCLTRRSELLMLSVRPETEDQVKAGYGLGVVQMKPATQAPTLHVATAAKRLLLGVDLSASDPALAGAGKRSRVPGDMEDAGSDDEVDDGHAGGKEAALRSGQRITDILDPSSINLPPVPDLFEPFMSTVLKPAPRQHQALRNPRAHETDATLATHPRMSTIVQRQKKRSSAHDAEQVSKLDEGLLAVLTREMKAELPIAQP